MNFNLDSIATLISCEDVRSSVRNRFVSVSIFALDRFDTVDDANRACVSCRAGVYKSDAAIRME